MAVDQKWVQTRAVEVDYFQQAQARRTQQLAAAQAERDAFVAKAQAYHAAREKAIERGEQPVIPPVKSLHEIFSETRRAELAAEAAAESWRLAALSPRDNIIAALPFQVRERIATYERIRGVPFPLEALQMR